MIDFLIQNIGTVLVGVVLLIVIVLVVYSICRNKKKGGGCSGCADCPHRK